MSPEFKRAHPKRAKIKAMKSYKNEDAICTIKRDHNLKIEQIHPKSNNLYKIDFDLKIGVAIFPNFWRFGILGRKAFWANFMNFWDILTIQGAKHI